MSSTPYRCLILIGILALANWLLAIVDGPPPERAARWPRDAGVYAATGWTAGPAAVDHQHGVSFISRGYYGVRGTTAIMTIATSPEAKRIYRAGAEIPFLGSGYTVDQAPPSLVPEAPGRATLLARRGTDRRLVLYTYGERRGLLGNGLPAWGMAFLDTTLGRPNDYFLASLVVRLDRLDSSVAGEAVALAETLFPRLAAWYAG